MKRFLYLLFLLSVILLLTGCSFSKNVSNPDVKNMDISFIMPGITAKDEILQRLGPPSVAAGRAAGAAKLSLLSGSVGGAPSSKPQAGPPGTGSDTILHYSCSETRVTEFFPSYYLYLDFSWSDTQTVDEITILLNPDRTVNEVIRTKRCTIRRPFESESDRKPAKTIWLNTTGEKL